MVVAVHLHLKWLISLAMPSSALALATPRRSGRPPGFELDDRSAIALDGSPFRGPDALEPKSMTRGLNPQQI